MCPGSEQVDLLSLKKKTSTNFEVELYGRAKIQTFTTGWPVCGKVLNFNPAV